MQVLGREGKQPCRLAEMKLQCAREASVTSDQWPTACSMTSSPQRHFTLLLQGELAAAAGPLSLSLQHVSQGNPSELLKLAASAYCPHRQRTMVLACS